jgi:hypothetical protein
MNLWKVAAIGAVALAAYLLYQRRQVPGGASPIERGDPRGTVGLAVQVLTKGAKEVAEDGKKAILGETKAHQRETDKKRRVGG